MNVVKPFEKVSAAVTACVGALVFAKGCDGLLAQLKKREGDPKGTAIAKSLGTAGAGGLTSWCAIIAAQRIGGRTRA